MLDVGVHGGIEGVGVPRALWVVLLHWCIRGGHLW